MVVILYILSLQHTFNYIFFDLYIFPLIRIYCTIKVKVENVKLKSAKKYATVQLLQM